LNFPVIKESTGLQFPQKY